MPNQIPLSKMLIEQIGSLLEPANFRLSQLNTNSIEQIVYERLTSNKTQTIVLSGGEDSANHIYVSVSSGEPNVFLSTLKELMPNFRALSGREQGRWEYFDEQELQRCVGEIADLIKVHLFSWLDNPVFNPSNVPNPFTVQQLKAQANEFKRMAEELQKEGHYKEAEGYEQNFKSIRKKLEDAEAE